MKMTIKYRFSLYAWLVSALKASYATYRFDDVIYHFTLSVDDRGPQEQVPKSQRTSQLMIFKSNEIFISLSPYTWQHEACTKKLLNKGIRV